MIYLSKIQEIESSLFSNRDYMSLAGLNDGILGFSLFYYCHHLLTKEETSFDKMIYFIEEALNRLNSDYKSHKVKEEIVEIGIYLLFLLEKGLLDEEEIKETLDVFDGIIEDFVYSKIKIEDLDYTIGSLKAGVYFLKRNSKKSIIVLDVILDTIERLAIKSDKGIYWKFKLRNEEIPKAELGLGHGISGIILFLLQSIELGFYKGRAQKLVHEALNFLISQKRESGINLFAINAFENEYFDYNNLSYGDIGIGYTLLRSGEVLNVPFYQEESLKILKNAARYRDEKKQFIRDANIVYGASGLYSFFNYIYKLTNEKVFYEAKDYWFSKILEFGEQDEENKWAGFQTYFNSVYDFAQLGFTQGISGIGIALISESIGDNKEYLQFLNYN